jgi:hypothetical protein
LDESIDAIDAGLAHEEPSIGPDRGGTPVYDREPESFESKVDAVLDFAADQLTPGPKLLDAIQIPSDDNLAKPDREPPGIADDPFNEIETFGDGPDREYEPSASDASVPEQPDASLSSGSPTATIPNPANQVLPNGGGIASGPDQNYTPADSGGTGPSYTPADGGISTGPDQNYSPADGS